MIIYILMIALIVLIDQWSKKIGFSYMEGRIFSVKKRFATIQTARNEGATLGFLRDKKRLLITAIMLMTILVSYYFVKAFTDNYPMSVKLGITMLLGGALGNLTDRFRYRYVRDFFSFNFKRSPIFNLADIFIFIGGIIIGFSVIVLG